MPQWTEERRKKASEDAKKRHAQRIAEIISGEPVKEVSLPHAQAKSSTKAPQPINLFSGDVQKTQVYNRDGTLGLLGYVTRWFTDEGNTGVRINLARRSGWEFVTREEVALNESLTPLNTNLGNYVSQVVNPHAEGGKPENGYLLKIPTELFERYQQERESRVHANIEAQLRRGMISNNPEHRQYAAGSAIAQATHSSIPQIDMTTKTYRR